VKFRRPTLRLFERAQGRNRRCLGRPRGAHFPFFAWFRRRPIRDAL